MSLDTSTVLRRTAAHVERSSTPPPIRGRAASINRLATLGQWLTSFAEGIGRYIEGANQSLGHEPGRRPDQPPC